MKRSKRIETLDRRPVNMDGYINEWPEMGFAAMNSPYDPKPVSYTHPDVYKRQRLYPVQYRFTKYRGTIVP